MRIRRVVLPVTAALAAVAFTAPPALAGDTSCTGSLTGAHDNVIVPPGAACALNNADVKGNVKALQDSTLDIANSRIGGNVEGDKADLVQVRDSVVGGNVVIKEGGPATGGGSVDCLVVGNPCEVSLQRITLLGGDVQVQKMTGDVVVGGVVFGGTGVPKGNIKVEDNFIPAGSLLRVRGNNVAQNLQVFKNTGPGQKEVTLNTVGANLQCFENASPFSGGGNTAAKAEGQCS